MNQMQDPEFVSFPVGKILNTTSKILALRAPCQLFTAPAVGLLAPLTKMVVRTKFYYLLRRTCLIRSKKYFVLMQWKLAFVSCFIYNHHVYHRHGINILHETSKIVKCEMGDTDFKSNLKHLTKTKWGTDPKVMGTVTCPTYSWNGSTFYIWHGTWLSFTILITHLFYCHKLLFNFSCVCRTLGWPGLQTDHWQEGQLFNTDVCIRTCICNREESYADCLYVGFHWTDPTNHHLTDWSFFLWDGERRKYLW